MAKSSTAVLASIVALLWTIPVFAQKADSIALRPAFGLDYIVEQQTDFQHFRMNNMLQLNADIPISRHFSFIFSTISFAATDSTPLAEDLQVYSNIEAYNNIALAFAVAGIEWNINEEHSLFAGIRRIDEDYFCSDALALFTNSSCGGFPTVTANFDIAAYPTASAGVHYAFEKENLTLQASLYNGTGHYRFAGRENVFRIRPRSDGVFGSASMNGRQRLPATSISASTFRFNLSFISLIRTIIPNVSVCSV
ncbi:MAG: hypothetical protein J6P50_01680 [Bacteroidales bacterium]|nr:hypothetical protein [Bacteroidales bacterium]